MDIVPDGVGSCLYHGISKKIEWINNCMDWHREDSKTNPKLLNRDLKDIEEAIGFKTIM